MPVSALPQHVMFYVTNGTYSLCHHGDTIYVKDREIYKYNYLQFHILNYTENRVWQIASFTADVKQGTVSVTSSSDSDIHVALVGGIIVARIYGAPTPAILHERHTHICRLKMESG